MSSGLFYSSAYSVLDNNSDLETVSKELIYLRNVLQLETTTPIDIPPSKVDWSKYNIKLAGKDVLTKMMCPSFMHENRDKTQALLSINCTLGSAFSQSFKKAVVVKDWIEAIEAALYRIIYKVESEDECPKIICIPAYSKVRFSVYRFVVAEISKVNIYIIFGDNSLLDYFFSNL